MMLPKSTKLVLLTTAVCLLAANYAGAMTFTNFQISPTLLQTAPTLQTSPSLLNQLKSLTPSDTLLGCSGAVTTVGPLNNNQYNFDVQWLIKHDLAQIFYYLYIRDDQKVVDQTHSGLAGGINPSHSFNAKYSLPAGEKSKTVKLTFYATDIWNTIVKPAMTCQVTLTNPNQAGLTLPSGWQTFSVIGTNDQPITIPDNVLLNYPSGSISGINNQPITIPDGILQNYPSGSISGINNQPITIPDGILQNYPSGSSSGASGATGATGAAASGSANSSAAKASSASSSGSTGTTVASNGAPTAAEPPPLMPSPDILTCKGTAKTLYFENDAPAYDWMGSNCVLTINALVRAGVYSEAYDPKAEDNSANLIKALSLEELKKNGRLYYSWKGYDDYDQPTEPGKYKLVVEARPGTAFSPDISIHSFVIENTPEAAPEEAADETAAGTAGTAETAGGSAAGAVGATSGDNLRGAAEEEPAPGLLEQLNQAVFGEGEASKAQETVQARVASKCPNTFYPTDIAGHAYEALIKKAYDECLVRGYADGTFRAEQGLTRAESTKIIVLASGKVAKQGCYDADCGSPFDDLEMWQGPWVRAAWDLKIVSGVGKNVFAPNRALTRAEAAALTMKAFNVPLHYGCYNAHCGAGLPDDPFTDVVQMWQGPYLRALWDKGVLRTLTPGRFYPDQPITRGQFIELTYLVKSLK